MSADLEALQIVASTKRYEPKLANWQRLGLIRAFNGYSRQNRLEIMSQLLGRTINSFLEISYGEANLIIFEIKNQNIQKLIEEVIQECQVK